MTLIIYFALIAAIVAAKRHSPGKAMLAVYLPVLLLLPDTYHAILPGIPKPSFNQAAIIPIFAVTLIKYGKSWKASIADLLVISLTCSIAYSEYQAAGYAEAQNLTFTMLTGATAPYFLARMTIARERLHVLTARCFAGILFGLALFGIFEAKFGFNPFLATLERFFPGQGGWVTTFRYGLARVAGPYVHAILAGVMMGLAYRLQRWLQWGGYWENRFKRISVPWSKPKVMTAGLILGSLMTVARGPWIGGFVGGALAMVSRSKNKKKALTIMLVTMVVTGIPASMAFSSYMDVAPGMPMTDSQESAIYRKVLMEKYQAIALDHALLGWGRNTWPKVGGMESIDNYYLLLSLMHGLLATGLLVTIMLWMAIRLILHGLKEPVGHNSLTFCFAGMIFSVMVALATVYLGENVLPAFFFILGWAEGLLQDPASDPGLQQNSVGNTAVKPKAKFRRIMA
jgi:hypothetical protein